jgi:hypothetical protein
MHICTDNLRASDVEMLPRDCMSQDSEARTHRPISVSCNSLMLDGKLEELGSGRLRVGLFTLMIEADSWEF